MCRNIYYNNFIFFILTLKDIIEDKKSYFLTKLSEIRKNVRIQNCFLEGGLWVILYKIYISKLYSHKIFLFVFFDRKYSTPIFLFYYDIANFGDMNFKTFYARKMYSFTIAHCKTSVHLYQFLNDISFTIFSQLSDKVN